MSDTENAWKVGVSIPIGAFKERHPHATDVLGITESHSSYTDFYIRVEDDARGRLLAAEVTEVYAAQVAFNPDLFEMRESVTYDGKRVIQVVPRPEGEGHE